MTIEERYEKKLLPDDVCEQHDERRRTVLRERLADGFERCIQIIGAHKCSKPRSDGSNHGIGSATMRFVLAGPAGATQWILNTGWFTRSTPPLPNAKPSPEAWDLCYHALTPQYDGQTSQGPCDWLGGKPCFYNSSGSRAMEPLPDFITHPDTIWTVLQEAYKARFGGAP